MLAELLLDPVRVAFEIDLVEGHDDGTRRLGVVDRLMILGITPSSAATTRTAMSATLPPRARIAVNARGGDRGR